MLPDIRETYETLKAQYPDKILLLQVGQAYVAFGPDAAILAAILAEVPLVRGSEIRFSRRLAQRYVKQLLDAGYTVALADEVAGPAAKRKVPRSDITTVTRGG